MRFVYKLEKKFGRYAIKNLPVVMTAVLAIGYFLVMFAPAATAKCTFVPYSVLIDHEYWRLFTWVLTPAGNVDFLSVMMLFFLVLFGRYIEAGMGTFLFNLYVLGIWFWNTLIMMGVSLYGYFTLSPQEFMYFGIMHTASMVMFLFDFGIFLAFALMYADTTVLFMFVIPIKTSWMAVINMFFLAYYFIHFEIMGRANIIAYLINFFIFYLLIGRGKGMRNSNSRSAQMRQKKEVQMRWQERQRQSDKTLHEKRAKQMTPSTITRHKCAICGKSEKDDPTLEFRFCSKCKGNYEYCNEHLFTHEHVK